MQQRIFNDLPRSLDPLGDNNNQPKEWYAFLIAAAMISAFIVYFGISLVSPEFGTSINDRLTVMKEVVALLGGYVAAVLVYYFGQKQVQNLTGTLKTAQEDASTSRKEKESIEQEYVDDASGDKEIIDIAKTAIEELEEQRQVLQEENYRLKAELENLKKKVEEKK